MSTQRWAGVKNTAHNILREDEKFGDENSQTNENRYRRFNCCVSVVLNRDKFSLKLNEPPWYLSTESNDSIIEVCVI